MDLLEWMNAAAEAAEEIATGALGMQTTRWEHLPTSSVPPDLCGVYIPLVTEGCALQFGMLGRPEVCETLARSLLGMGPDEALGDELELFDAVGEVTNLVAGGIKAKLAGRADIRLGLPLALKGQAFPASGTGTAQGILQMNDSDVWLVVSGFPGA